MPHYSSSSNKKYKRRKGAKPDDSKNKDTKGFWEYSHNQKIVVENKEEEIKRNLRFLGGFDPSKVKDYINPHESKEEILEKKVREGKKLSGSEKIIFDNIREKRDKAVKKDLDLLSEFKLNADVTTEFGKTRKLLMSLEYLLKREDNIRIALK